MATIRALVSRVLDAPRARGRLADKRPIATRPAGATYRTRVGQWEGDTMLGDGQSGPCV